MRLKNNFVFEYYNENTLYFIRSERFSISCVLNKHCTSSKTHFFHIHIENKSFITEHRLLLIKYCCIVIDTQYARMSM